MKDIGVRVARQRLLRYRVPQPEHVRWRKWILLAVAAWGVWAVLLSDHSVSRLLHLRSERERLSRQLDQARNEVQRAERDVPRDHPTMEEAERILRERHNYARDGELIYILGEDTARVVR